MDCCYCVVQGMLVLDELWYTGKRRGLGAEFPLNRQIKVPPFPMISADGSGLVYIKLKMNNYSVKSTNYYVAKVITKRHRLENRKSHELSCSPHASQCIVLIIINRPSEVPFHGPLIASDRAINGPCKSVSSRFQIPTKRSDRSIDRSSVARHFCRVGQQELKAVTHLVNISEPPSCNQTGQFLLFV